MANRFWRRSGDSERANELRRASRGNSQTRRGNEAAARRRPHVPRNRSHARPRGFHDYRHGRRLSGTWRISISAALGEPRSLRSNRRGLRSAWFGAAQDPEGRPAVRGYVRRNPASCGTASAAASSGVCGDGRVTQTRFSFRSRTSARILRKTLRARSAPQQRLATAGDELQVTQSVAAFERRFSLKGSHAPQTPANGLDYSPYIRLFYQWEHVMATPASPPTLQLPPIVYAVFCGAMDQASAQRFFTGFASASSQNVKEVHVLFQSLGGNVAEGIALYNFFRALTFDLILYNVAQVSSSALIAYLGAKKRKTSAHASFMTHRTTSPAIGIGGREAQSHD